MVIKKNTRTFKVASLAVILLSSRVSGFSSPNPDPSPVTATTTATSEQQQWKPKVANLAERRERLRGEKHDSELIGSLGFHHIEFYCGDAKSTAARFALALGMSMTGSTGQHTGNDKCISYGLESGDLRFLLTAPYSQAVVSSSLETAASAASEEIFDAPQPLPGFVPSEAHEFFAKHGLAARAIGLEVKDAEKSFRAAVANGATPVLEPTFMEACVGQTKLGLGDELLSACRIAEVQLYDDVVLRFVAFEEQAGSDLDIETKLPFLPHLAPPADEKMAKRPSYGLQRIDHAVGNVPDLYQALNHIKQFLGFHEFAEFTPEDVGTTESGLNSVVLASDSENVLLPLNEPTSGKRKSQILTYLEQNEGAGLQHLALKTNDIFKTITHMREAEDNLTGFELMRRPSDAYYRELPDRLGDQLSPEQYERLEELGILADADDEGILLQIFTKPIGDRPTLFFEIIQRIGCRYHPEGSSVELERPGCGGFGQGNFRELFKSIEDYEKTLKV